MKITILCVGKIKEKFYRDAIEEYAKRLTRYCKLEIIEVADEKTPDGASATEEMQIRQKEGERVLARLEKCRQSSSYVMALAIDGRELDSVELSQKLEKLGTDGISHVIFLIGGSLGMSKELLAAADFKSAAYADSATIACHMSDNTNYYTCRTCLCQYLTFKEKRQACRKTSLPKGIKEKWRAPALCGSFRKPYPRFSYHGAYP